MSIILASYQISNIHVYGTHSPFVDSRSLSKTEARVILSLEAESKDLVTLEGIRQRAGVSPGFARKLAHDLANRGWLQRVRPGTYLLNPSRHGPDALPDTDPLRFGSHLAEPYYFGYATAAELHGLFPQASRIYYIVTTVRRAATGHSNSRFRLIRIDPSRFFGVGAIVRRGATLEVSDPERTVIDCLDRPELSGGMAGIAQIFALAKPQLNWERFGRYLDRFGNRSLIARAGFLAESVRPSLRPPAAWVRTSLPGRNDPFVPLGPPSVYGRRGERDGRWHIIRNVPETQLFAEAGTR